MSITDELREWARNNTVQDKVLTTYPVQHPVHGTVESLLRIADRIDTEHEREVADTRNDALYHANDKDMADLGWVRLPKDADGEYVHIGDVMVYADGNTCPMKAVALVPPAVFLTEDGPRYADMCRHKQPTVEDVLHDFICDHEEGVRDEADLIAEYAKRLRLAGSDAE